MVGPQRGTGRPGASLAGSPRPNGRADRREDEGAAPATAFSGDEIDTVLESRAGDIACVECKAAATVASADYRAIVKLRDARGDRFIAGAVIYTGAETRPLTEKIWAIPVNALWGTADPPVTASLASGSIAVTDRQGAGARRTTTR